MSTLQLDQILRNHIPATKFDDTIRALMQDELLWRTLNDTAFQAEIEAKWPPSVETMNPAVLTFFSVDPIIACVGYPEASLPDALLEEAMLGYEAYRTQSTPLQSMRECGLMAIALYEKFHQTGDWSRILFEITENGDHRRAEYMNDFWKSPFAILAAMLDDPRPFFQALFDSKARKNAHTLFRHLVLTQPCSRDEQANLVISTLFSQPADVQAAVLKSFQQNSDNELLTLAAKGLFSRHLIRDLDDKSVRELWQEPAKYLEDGNSYRDLAVIAQFAGEHETAEKLLTAHERILKTELAGSMIQSAALKLEQNQGFEDTLAQIPSDMLKNPEIAAEIACLGPETVHAKGIDKTVTTFEMNEAVKMFQAGNIALARESAAKSVQSWLAAGDANRITEQPLRAISWQPGRIVDQLCEMEMWVEASALVRELLSQFPVNVNYLNQAALIAGKLGDRPEQLAHLEKLNLLSPDNEEYRRSLANASLASENWQAAFNAFQRLVDEHHADARDDLLGMAKSALKCGEFAVAQEYAQKVLASDADNGQALAISGYAWHKQGNAEKALSLLDRAIELSSEDCEPWLLRADLYAENGETTKSVNTLRSALTAHPENEVLRTRLARTLIENEQASEALAVISENESAEIGKEMALLKLRALKLMNLPELAATAEQLYQVYPADGEIRREYAVAQLEKGNRELVRKLVDPAAIAGDEELTLAYCDSVLGEDYRNLHTGKSPISKEHDKAKSLLSETLTNDPASVYGRMLLAETMIHEGKTEKAFEFLTNLLGDPDAQNSNWFDRIRAGFAWAASLLGNSDQAIDVAQSVVESNPEWAGASQTLAEIQANTGEVADAMSQAVNVLDTAADMVSAVEWFGKFMDGLGKPEEAEKILQEVAEKRKEKTPFLLKRAEYKIERGEKEEALALLEPLKASLAKMKTDAEFVKTAKTFARLGERETAEECLSLRSASESSEQQSALVDLAGFQYANGKYAKALQTIAQIKSRFGAQRWIELIEAETLHSNDNAQAALEMLQELDAANEFLPASDELSFVPAQWVPLLQPQASTDSLIRSLAFESGNYQEALQSADDNANDPSGYSIAIEADYALANNGPVQAWVNVEIGDDRIYQSATMAAEVAEILLDNGIIDRAAEVIKRGLELFPQERGLLVNASRYSGMIGDLNTAEALFDQVLPHFSATEKFNSIHAVCALRNLLKAAATLNRWMEALLWQNVLLQANQTNMGAVQISLQTLVRSLEFALFTEELGVRVHFDHKPETIENIRKGLRALLAGLESQNNHFFDHWTARAKAALDPNQTNVRTLALKTPEADDVAAMMLALHRSGQGSTAQQLTAKFENDSKVAYASAFCLKDSNPEKALEILKKSTRSSVMPWSNVLAQRLYQRTGENYSAINEMEEAVQSWPQEPEWHVLAAECWQRTGDNQNAINHLETATKLLPDDGRMKYLLGKAYLQANESEKAIQTLESAAKTAANHYETWETLAEAYYNSGNKEKALQAAEKAGTINGFSVKPLLLSARINLDNGDLKKALEQAQAANKHDEQDAESLVLLGKTWLANGNKMQAMQALEKVAHARNASAPVLIEQAKLVQEINGPASAKLMLEALVQKYPENVEVLNLLSEAQLAAGDKAAAETTAQRSLKVQELQPKVQRFIGKLDLDAGHLDQAIHHFSQAIAQEPQEADVYMDLGEAYIQQRDFDAALKTLDRAIELAPGDIRPLMTAANLLRNGKDYSNAESRLRRAAEIAPNDLNIRRQLGAVIALNMVHSSQEASSHI